ncbi:hypothetical protein J4G48_0015240 [Bradyrhizobium barranii subsp. apii]|uniref:hypothetical protein n=1 Tax=Bradyrhizobium barranii TaxID=2992140 RepID=UPI001AA1A011|nr:hypothetical protein [Bradyrhizobium barranii]UPT99318.1 hypothetical protein J4G48_0015240 [Bradyrhizobium barranii subsp. apii]
MISLDTQKIIDDLSFRAAWLEKTIQMNIARLEAMAKRAGDGPSDARALLEDTINDFRQLQIHAADRVRVFNAEPAVVIALRPALTAQPRPELATS